MSGELAADNLRKQSNADPEIVTEISEIFNQQHGTRVCRFRDVAQIVLLLVILAAAILAINTQDEKLVQLSRFIEGLGLIGHVVFFLLFMWVAMPCGYNWSTIVVLVGFAYGWAALIDTFIGTIAGALASYFTSRRILRSCVNRYVSRLSVKKRTYLAAVTKVMHSGKAGFLMQILLRLQPVQTFGLTNAFFGVFTSIPALQYVLSTCLGSVHSICLLTSVGILMRDAGSLGEAMESPAGQLNLIVTAVVSIFAIVICIFMARYLMIHVLPDMIDKNALGCVDASSLRPTIANDVFPIALGCAEASSLQPAMANDAISIDPVRQPAAPSQDGQVHASSTCGQPPLESVGG